ncbi:hypothetical protein BBK36DRAFT_1194271 [Trichoderma citrinoviride]|uniref:Uncharacterized protein n=1 Tax=Trichoderma citrinoviride TaxID=58853 RepID=A0A2T4BF08_9HYPO|nr:hypothetical protein BBK36DRAFT_1194271 [Trichoderma citrinoviride]PTB67922.1 hypothetical protein BBK36DRAFT_1194271 [Trichoderma citrinoviride]
MGGSTTRDGKRVNEWERETEGGDIEREEREENKRQAAQLWRREGRAVENTGQQIASGELESAPEALASVHAHSSQPACDREGGIDARLTYVCSSVVRASGKQQALLLNVGKEHALAVAPEYPAMEDCLRRYLGATFSWEEAMSDSAKNLELEVWRAGTGAGLEPGMELLERHAKPCLGSTTFAASNYHRASWSGPSSQ